jgi:NADH-quinone oxidoreductase subunit B
MEPATRGSGHRAPEASARPGGPVVPPAGSDLPGMAAPLVVPNTFWTPVRGTLDTSSRDELGDGTRGYPDPTHLRDLEGLREEEELHGAKAGRFTGVGGAIPTTADQLLDLIRLNSLWPLLSGLACCAIEMMSAATSRHDMDRFSMFPFRASPRQADVLIVAGTLTTKMAGPLLRLWEQMPEPKWCVAMGDCTTTGGRYKRSYSTVQGIDRIMPVHVYIAGCPPRPEGLIYGMMTLQQLIREQRGTWRERPIGPTVPDGV